MAALSIQKLKEHISEILKGADLNSLSSKKVRLQLEEKLGVDLTARKKEIDAVVMEMISGSQSESEESSDEQPNKKAANGKNGAESVKEKKLSKVQSKNDEDSDGSADELDDEMLARKLQEEESRGRSRAVKKSRSAPRGGGGGGGGGSGKGKRESTYSRKCKLSPELADVVGAPEMARHDVVKKMWEIVKTRNLYDQKNKQFAICDDQLMTVFGVRRFRTFGMMKYLKSHITDQR